MSYQSLLPLINKVKSNLSPEEFHSVINVIFHNYEASSYDSMHADMKNSLQEQIDLLVSDYLKDNTALDSIKMLDIGCGTGMSTELILKSEIGLKVKEVTLLDTSPKMLEIAEEKAKKWGINYSVLNGDIKLVTGKYDLIIVCSVLHHIPLIQPFIKNIDKLLNIGGVFIHLQDPNGDYLNAQVQKNRVKEFKNNQNIDSTFTVKKLFPKSLKKYISRILGRKTYIDLINDELLIRKVIKKRLTADEIWSVTDIHVETKDSTDNKGISFDSLRTKLPNYKIVSRRSYGFFGPLKSDLDNDFAKREQELIDIKNITGRNLSCLWMKRDH
jgi:2-polyprenyl-3-methyl-5-hydroxy-6-metoxy-1,4-benzoquinol methylase